MDFYNQSVSADNRWLELYNEAVVFYKTHRRFPTYKDNARLYRWAMQWWRNSYIKSPSLLAEKAHMLTEIGFTYRSMEEMYGHLWMTNYEKAKAFYNEYGHFPTMSEHKGLHTWARSWSVLYAQKQPEKADMLRQIGYVYQSVAERNDEQWMKNYLQCKEFFDKNGHFPEKTDDIRLRNWVNRWWKKTAEQQPEKAEMLSQLGFRYKSNIEVADERWYANYTLAKDFFDKHGRFPLYKEDTKIHSWARMWWKNSYLKNPVANEEKAQKLRNIGYKSHKPEDDEQNIQT